MSRVLLTGGAGFVGANLAVGLSERHPDWELIALDSLHRNGSELNLPRLQSAGVEFVKADVRDREALASIDGVDAVVECSAEPSALAGLGGDADFIFDTNLAGAYNCLELARRNEAQFVFLSTSRVYPYGPLADLRLERAETRYELAAEQNAAGAGRAGISEEFTIDGARTIYGATKLAAELLVTEYAASFGLDTVIDRFGVIAGPWQMGRVDQGVFTFWLLHHHFDRPLSYIGYDGEGRQVRDLLHVEDAVALVEEQLLDRDGWAGFTGNVGGGRSGSLSLLETTAICRELTGRELEIGAAPEPRPGDVPLYISDCARLYARTSWRPEATPRRVLEDTYEWICANEDMVGRALGFS